MDKTEKSPRLSSSFFQHYSLKPHHHRVSAAQTTAILLSHGLALQHRLTTLQSNSILFLHFVITSSSISAMEVGDSFHKIAIKICLLKTKKFPRQMRSVSSKLQKSMASSRPKKSQDKCALNKFPSSSSVTS